MGQRPNGEMPNRSIQARGTDAHLLCFFAKGIKPQGEPCMCSKNSCPMSGSSCEQTAPGTSGYWGASLVQDARGVGTQCANEGTSLGQAQALAVRHSSAGWDLHGRSVGAAGTELGVGPALHGVLTAEGSLCARPWLSTCCKPSSPAHKQPGQNIPAAGMMLS